MLIEDYAMIGDCETAALVGRNGSIDWLCWPSFESDACFAALLGTRDNGRWKIGPCADAVEVSRRYLPDTLVLETTFRTATGEVTLTDFMPPRGKVSDVVRIVRCVSGSMDMQTEFILRFGYGAIVPWVTKLDDGRLSAIAGPDMVLIDSDVPLHGEGFRTVGDFTMTEGQSLCFTITFALSFAPEPPPRLDPQQALKDTCEFWTEWVTIGRTPDRWCEAVTRSLIVLKALTFGPSGGIVAAPTTSLPEWIGSTRNWDYRYCWLRDATLTLSAFMRAGHFEEARAWRDWLVRAVAGAPSQIQIMYGILGNRRLPEWEVPWLVGYEESKPVRVGNGAHDQLQLDVFGEVADAFYQARLGGLPAHDYGWGQQLVTLEHLESIWREPDEGIWEVRGGRRHFTFSKVMAWVAFDRAIRVVEEFGREGPVDRWRAVRDEIHAEVCDKGFDRELNSFVQYYGSTHLDASLLLLPRFGFLPADDPRIVSTIAAIESRLRVDGLVLRYDTDTVTDGLPPGEGAFLACSFWLVDAYVMLGRLDEAKQNFETLLSYRNDVGLLAEEYDPVACRQLGNFPQAFSHIALVHSAFLLAEALDEKPGKRSERDDALRPEHRPQRVEEKDRPADAKVPEPAA